MQDRVHHSQLMNIEEFLDFTEERPDGEKWELIEGKPVLSPSPTNFHQLIVGNILFFLDNCQQQSSAQWVPLIGIGTRVPISPRSLPQPDLMVHETAPTEESPVTDDGFVLFEVLSKSNTKSDQTWRKNAYASIANCQHYVTVAQKKPLVTRFDRAAGWKRVEYTHLSDTLELPCLGVGIPLLKIYRRTPVAART